MNLKTYFEDCMFDSKGRFCSPKTNLRYHQKRNTEVYNILLENKSKGISVPETVYREINGIIGVVTCEFCETSVEFNNFKLGYKSTCGSENCLKKAYGKNPPEQTKSMRRSNSERMKKNNPMFNPKVVSKVMETQKKSNGGSLPLHSEDSKLKALNSRFDRYNTFSPKSKFFKSKKYELPSGKIVNIQGYENMALDILFKKYKEDDVIICGKNHMIYYKLNGKKLRYFPDIYIPNKDLYIEVKSDYTLEADYLKNLKKQNSIIKLGHDFEFWVLNNKGDLTIKKLF